MKQARPTLSMGYVAALLDAAGVSPAQAALLLRQQGLSGDAGTRLTEQQFSRLYRSLAVALDDEMLSLFSRPMRPGALKYTCLALLDAKNLQVALHRWTCLYRVVQDDFHLELDSTADSARIALVQAPGAEPCSPFTADLLLKVIHGVASWLTGRRLPLLRVDFHFARPAFADDYEMLYPGPVFFGQPEPALVMDAGMLRLPIRRSALQLADFMKRAPQDWVFAHPSKLQLGQRLREYLTERLPLPATAEGAAEALAVSVRTLHRHLVDEGTTFQRVKDEFRRERAVQLLTTSETPINRISAELGFDSVAAFHRAFRGWTGGTPGAFRNAEGPRA
jgi:AraC-like DNA-binding protein